MSFQAGGENERVQHRLDMVLRAYRSGGFHSKDPRIFCALADAAFFELPPLASRGMVDSYHIKEEESSSSSEMNSRGSSPLETQATNSLFENCVQMIESAYQDLGYSLGWRFLNVSRSVLSAPVRVAFITINPGGDSIPLDHPEASCEDGISHLVESWDRMPPGQSTLQLQVQGLFRALAEGLKFSGSFEELMEKSLISQFIPFRSPTVDSLLHWDQSVQFGRLLWARILPVLRPTLIICLGREVQKELRSLVPNAQACSPIMSRSYETGWGQYKADLDDFTSPFGLVRLLYVPHLSRYQLFNNPKCSNQMRIIIDAVCEGL